MCGCPGVPAAAAAPLPARPCASGPGPLAVTRPPLGPDWYSVRGTVKYHVGHGFLCRYKCEPVAVALLRQCYKLAFVVDWWSG
ncbi:hypothetical protein L226DRAFT_528657 [Lentinus tigrinus ALCF2SS1-7]|uniref:uncharacterized protein n=1 Tax=Lentinus tigrinus ALCF2SS1-7 TaxID=1328758 RepID=UPI0011661A23|nr:hypothetical protein L226DRAFT_528657 [Lentinus tigrinus ALCF2SS1-7]